MTYGDILNWVKGKYPGVDSIVGTIKLVTVNHPIRSRQYYQCRPPNAPRKCHDEQDPKKREANRRWDLLYAPDVDKRWDPSQRAERYEPAKHGDWEIYESNGEYGARREDGQGPEPDTEVAAPEEPEVTNDLTALADELLIDAEELRKMRRLLLDRRQIVFYGPPGTGKTYVAREFAKFLAGSNERVKRVQFHPAYAYEDFIEGIRPRLAEDQVGFHLAEGPLKLIARQAVADPDHTYVLIIDELNRGNVAKVFGELY